MPPPESCTLADLWERGVARHGARVCLMVRQGAATATYSFASLDALANKVAAWAQALRFRDGPLLKIGDAAAMFMGNTVEAIALMLGLAKLGVHVAWVRRAAGRSAAPYTAAVRAAHAKLVFVDDSTAPMLGNGTDAAEMCAEYREGADDGPQIWHAPAELMSAARGAVGRQARGGRASAAPRRHRRSSNSSSSNNSMDVAGDGARMRVLEDLPTTSPLHDLLRRLDAVALGGAGCVAPAAPPRSVRAGHGMRHACMVVYKEQEHAWHPTPLELTTDAFWAVGVGLSAGVGLTESDVISTCGIPLSHPIVCCWGLSLAIQSGAALALSPAMDSAAFWDEARQQRTSVMLYAQTAGEPCVEPVRRICDEAPAWGVHGGAEREQTHRVRLALGNGLQRGGDVRAIDAFQLRFGIPQVKDCSVHAAHKPASFLDLGLHAHPRSFAFARVHPYGC